MFDDQCAYQGSSLLGGFNDSIICALEGGILEHRIELENSRHLNSEGCNLCVQFLECGSSQRVQFLLKVRVLLIDLLLEGGWLVPGTPDPGDQAAGSVER